MADDILGKLGEAIVLLRADGKQLNEDMKKEKAALEKKIDDLGSSLTSKGKILSVGLTAPLMAMGAAAVTAGFTVDEALDTIRIQTGATGDALGVLEEDFASVFANVPDDAKTVADTLSLVNTRLGVTGEAAQTLTERLLTMSRITETDVKANTEAATQAFNAWGISTDKQAESLDLVFKVSQQTGASVTELMQVVTENQGVFSEMNMSFEESVVFLGQINKEGVKSTDAIAGMRRAIASFNEANIPAREGLDKTFKLIKDLGPGAESTSLAIDVFGTKAGPSLASAIAQGRLSVDDLMKTVKGSSETILTAAKDTDGFAESFAQLKNKAILALEPLGTALITIAEKALPYLLKLGDAVLAITQGFSDLPGPVQGGIIALGAVAAAAGPTLLIAGQLVGQWKNVLTAYTYLQKATPGLVSSLGRTTTALGLVGKGVAVVSVAFAGWKIGRWIGETTGLTDAVERLAGRVMGLTSAEIEAGMAARKAAERQKQQKQETTELDASVADLERQVAALADTTVEFSENDLRAFQNQIGKSKDETDEFTKKVKGLTDQFGRAAVNEGRAYAVALQQIGGTQRLTNAEIEQFNKVLGDALTKLTLLGDTSSAEFMQIREAWLETQNAMFNSLINKNPLDPKNFSKNFISGDDFRKMMDLGRMQSDFNKLIMTGPQALQNMINNMGGITITKLQSPPSVITQYGKTILNGLTGPGGFTDKLGPTIMQAITGGGDIGKSVGGLLGQTIGESTSKMFGGYLTKNLGKTLGGAIGSIIPGLGTLAGTFIGQGLSALGGKIVGMFTNATKGAREEFAKSLNFVNLDALYKDLQKLGAEGERLAHVGMNVVGRNDKAANEAWMQDVLKFYDDVAQKQEETANQELEARNKLQAAIDKYGFTIEELGPKWRQQRMTEQAQELVEEYTILTASGIEVDTVIRRMGDSINEFVQTAMKTGSEVPESMRPMLQRMVDMGLLTDENGKKFDSLEDTGLTFSMTLSQGFQGVIDKLEEVVLAITGRLGSAIENMPSPRITPVIEEPTGWDGEIRVKGRGKIDIPEFNDGGVANFGAGTLALLHNTEAVIPLDRLENMLAMGGSSKSDTMMLERLTRQVSGAFLEMKSMLPSLVRQAVQGA